MIQANDFTHIQIVMATLLDEDYTEKMKRFPRMSYNTGGLVRLQKPIGLVYMVLIAE